MQITNLDDEYKTQEQWIPIFNKEGQKMISAPDTYKLYQENNQRAIGSLRKEFEERWLVTSTRMIYSKDNLKATIIHDADSTVIKQKKYKNILVPDYSGSFKEDKVTKEFLQALFDTKDNIAKILATLRDLSGKQTIRLWTPSQSSRKDKQVRAVFLYCDDLGRFDVVGYVWFGSDYVGCSHGVIDSKGEE